MSYRLDKKAHRKKFFKIAAGFVLLGALFYFSSYIFPGVSALAGESLRPLLGLSRKASGVSANIRAYFSGKASLFRENERLTQELELLRAKTVDHDALLSENENLKKILGRTREGKPMLLASILSKPPQSPYDTLVLDAGERQSIKPGAYVYAWGEVPVGRVDSASSDVSRVVLFSTAGETTQAILPLLGGEDVFWELVGRGGGNFEMILPRDFALKEGDTAVAPGISMYPIATVEAILSDPRDPFKKALLSSPVNIQTLKFVEVEL